MKSFRFSARKQRIAPGYEQLESRRLLAADPYSASAIVLEPVSQMQAVGSPAVQAAGDLNGDGHLDLVVGLDDRRVLQTYLGTGDGEFMAGPQLSRIAFHQDPSRNRLLLQDLDRDGATDLLFSDGTQIIRYDNLGSVDGVWQGLAASDLPPIDVAAYFLAAEDLNGDGLVDLVTRLTSKVEVRFGQADGSFASTAISYSGGAEDTALGDLDADGDLDLVRVRSNNTPGLAVRVLLNDGEGFFEPAPVPSTHPRGFQQVVLADFNHDGYADLAGGHAGGFEGGSQISILLGNGDGTFADSFDYELVGAARTLDVGDLNNDGHLDLVAVNFGSFHHPEYGNGPSGAVVMLGRGNGQFDAPVRIASFDLQMMWLADVDDAPGDELLTLRRAFLSTQMHTLETHRMVGSRALHGTATVYPFETDRLVHAIPLLADLDADGRHDVVTYDYATRQVTVDLARQDGRYEEALIATDVDVERMMVEDVTGDGRPDLVVWNTDTVTVYDGTDFSTAHRTRFASGYGDRHLFDVDQDGLLDLVSAVGAFSGNQSRIELRVGWNQGNGSFRAERPITLPGNSFRLAPADADASQLELLVLDPVGRFLSLSTLTSLGTLSPPLSHPLTAADTYITLADDVTGDGRTDFVLVEYAARPRYHIVSRQDNGGLTVTNMTVQDTQELAALDLNHDGLKDLVETSSTYRGHLEAYVNQGQGEFTASPPLPIGRGLGAFEQVDLDQDGYWDFVTTISESAPGGGVIVLYGNPDDASTTIEMYTIAPGRVTGLSNFVIRDGIRPVFEDVDGDGDLDILVAGAAGFTIITNDTAQRWRRGDMDRNGTINDVDLNALCHAVRFGLPNPAAFDLSGDGILNLDDVGTLVQDILRTGFGDANLDGRFDSSDLVAVFQAGMYESNGAVAAGWAQGDWDCDGRFTTRDLVQAFSFGSYVREASAPEPWGDAPHLPAQQERATPVSHHRQAFVA